MTLHMEDLRPPRPRNNTALPKEGGGDGAARHGHLNVDCTVRDSKCLFGNPPSAEQSPAMGQPSSTVPTSSSFCSSCCFLLVAEDKLASARRCSMTVTAWSEPRA